MGDREKKARRWRGRKDSAVDEYELRDGSEVVSCVKRRNLWVVLRVRIDDWCKQPNALFN